MRKNYFKGIYLETEIVKKFQKFIENKTNLKSFLTKRKKSNASIDFIGRLYDKNTNKTIKELAVEVRTLFFTKEKLNELNSGFINFPISKLNEIFLFRRLGKDIYIVYRLGGENGKIYFINFEYYLEHNFKLEKKFIKKENGFKKEEYVLQIPLKNLILIQE